MLASFFNNVRVSEIISASTAIFTSIYYILEKKKDLDKALGEFKETDRTEIAMALGGLIVSTTDIAVVCDNLATLSTVWAEVRRDFFDILIPY